ncbi:IS1182 family transposase, partial [Apilactobacillus micheneri]
TKYLRKNYYIDDVSFIDGTKILANANKYSFVWRKNIIRFDKLNREAIIKLLHDMNDVKYVGEIPDGSDISTSELDEIIIHLENCLADLNDQIKQNKKLSSNSNKQRRRKLKSIKRKLRFRKDKLVEYQETNKIFDNRNSYSKTDHDATFMRVKKDPMLNGQLKTCL